MSTLLTYFTNRAINRGKMDDSVHSWSLRMPGWNYTIFGNLENVMELQWSPHSILLSNGVPTSLLTDSMSLSSLPAVQCSPPETSSPTPIRWRSLSTRCAAAEGSTSISWRLCECAVASFSLFLTRGWRWEWRPWSSSMLEDAKCGGDRGENKSSRLGKASNRQSGQTKKNMLLNLTGKVRAQAGAQYG